MTETNGVVIRAGSSIERLDDSQLLHNWRSIKAGQLIGIWDRWRVDIQIVAILRLDIRSTRLSFARRLSPTHRVDTHRASLLG